MHEELFGILMARAVPPRFGTTQHVGVQGAEIVPIWAGPVVRSTSRCQVPIVAFGECRLSLVPEEGFGPLSQLAMKYLGAVPNVAQGQEYFEDLKVSTKLSRTPRDSD